MLFPLVAVCAQSAQSADGIGFGSSAAIGTPQHARLPSPPLVQITCPPQVEHV
jgi:hypothetical protein